MATPNLLQFLRDFDYTARLDHIDYYVERPSTPALAISRGLQRKPGCHYLFCGSIGSGKSTELAYLGRLLDDSVEPSYFVIGLDVYASLDNVATVRPAEMLMLIGGAVVRTYQDWYGRTIPEALLMQLREAFKGAQEGALKRVEPPRIIEGVALMTWGAVSANPDAVAKAGAGVLGAMGKLFKGKTQAPIGGLTRESARESDPDVVALVQAVNDVLDHVREEDGREPVVLVDGLDKIDRVQGMGTIRQLFCERLLSTVNASCVYSVPITMMLQTEWHTARNYFQRERLTNLVVEKPTKHECEPELVANSRALMREVVTKRLSKRQTSEAELFEDGALDRLISMSGGVMRNLIYLVHQALDKALDDGSARISLAHVEQAIHKVSLDYEITMNGAWRKELELVAASGEPSGSNDALELLLMNFILHYRNGHSWWAPDPFLGRLLEWPT